MKINYRMNFILLRQRMRASIKRLKYNSKNNRIYKIPELPEANSIGIAVAAIVKNEALYLPEWLEFHFMIGVRHIYIYDNGSTDNTKNILEPYLQARLVTLIPWRNFSMSLNPQRLAYAHALGNYGEIYRWIAFIDVDEFLFPVDDCSLATALNNYNSQPVICLPWINFGPSGHKKKPAGLVIESYTERTVFPPLPEQHSLLRYKSILNPRAVEMASSHIFHLKNNGPKMINDRCVSFPYHQARNTEYATADKLRLHHYFTRSEEEIQIKLAKGRVSKSGRININTLDRKLRQFEIAKEQDSLIMRYVPELKKRLQTRYSNAHVIPQLSPH